MPGMRKETMMGTWTGGRRRKLKPKLDRIKTLVVTSPLFFAKRDKNGDPIDPIEWSEDLLRSVSEQWPQVLVFCSVPPELKGITSSIPVEDLGLTNMKVILYSVQKPEIATRIWKQAIIEIGGVFRPAGNPREVVYLSLKRHFDAPHITWVGSEDHSKAKVEIDKEKSFKDLQQLRRKKADW